MADVNKLKKKAADFEQKKQFDKALQVYVELLDAYDSSDEEVDLALYNRVGDLFLKAGNTADAVVQFTEALGLRSDNAQALAGLAWIRATAADPSLRDSAEAVSLAERADDITRHQDVIVIDALGAAYAAAARYEDAIRVVKTGLALSTAAGQVSVTAQFRQRLDLYQTGQPLRIPKP